jgi:hypothetical protein
MSLLFPYRVVPVNHSVISLGADGLVQGRESLFQ